jgi:hypothetical protein
MLLTAACAWAQPEKPVQKIIEVKFADPANVADAIRIFGVNVGADRSLHIVSIRGTAEQVAAAEEAIKKLDVAPLNVELTVYLVNGVGGPKAGVTDEVPSELASTVKQLHGLFPYKSYRLTESFVLRAREGRPASSSGLIPGGTNYQYHFNYQRTTVSPGNPRVIHVDSMQLNVATPISRGTDGKSEYRSVGIGTDIDVGEGQKIVVGKSNFNGTDDALILVVTAKVLQ